MPDELWSRTQEYQSLSGIRPIALSRLHDHWNEVRHGEDVPRQRDVAPSRVPECTGNIALVALEREPARARYVIVGQNLQKLLGRDPTGKTVEAVYGRSVAHEVYDAFGKVVRSREPSFYRRDFVIFGQPFGYFRLILPLRVDNDEITRLLIGIYPTSSDLVDARPWRRALAKLDRSRRNDLQEDLDGIGKAWDDSLRD